MRQDKMEPWYRQSEKQASKKQRSKSVQTVAIYTVYMRYYEIGSVVNKPMDDYNIEVQVKQHWEIYK